MSVLVFPFRVTIRIVYPPSFPFPTKGGNPPRSSVESPGTWPPTPSAPSTCHTFFLSFCVQPHPTVHGSRSTDHYGVWTYTGPVVSGIRDHTSSQSTQWPVTYLPSPSPSHQLSTCPTNRTGLASTGLVKYSSTPKPISIVRRTTHCWLNGTPLPLRVSHTRQGHGNSRGRD